MRQKPEKWPEMLILQHPAESREPLSSLPLLRQYFPFIHVAIGLSWPNLAVAWGKSGATTQCPHKDVMICYPTLGKQRPYRSNLPSSQEDCKTNVQKIDSPLPLQAAKNVREAQLIVLLDGTWSQTKTILWRNRWLQRYPSCTLQPHQPSIYGKIRPAPRKECVSTLEAGLLVWESCGAEHQYCQEVRSKFRQFVQIIRDQKRSQSQTLNDLPKSLGTAWDRREKIRSNLSSEISETSDLFHP